MRKIMPKTTKTIASQISKTPQVTAPELPTSEPLTPKPLKVLITRPEVKAQQFALLLNKHGINCTSQALFDYQPSASAQEIKSSLKKANIVIFISVAAVEFAHASLPLSATHQQLFFAVGSATKRALHAIGINKVLSPPSQQENSEGLLSLAELENVGNKKVVIVRGNGGREHIAQSLLKRGAQVSYIESYQRVWRQFTKNIAKQWQAQQINCIVVTSNDILSAMLKHLMNNATNSLDSYWKTQCLWVVVSERIANNAKTFGLQRVINTHSASSQIICDMLQDIACS